MIRIIIKSTLLLTVSLFIAGCGLSSRAMIAKLNSPINSTIDKSIKVAEVIGAKKNTFGGPTFITNKKFKKVLITSLKKSGIFKEVKSAENSDFELYVRIIDQDQILPGGFGLTYLARMSVEYKIVDRRTGNVMWETVHESEHAKTAISGVSRTLQAREGAVKKNLEIFIKGINIWNASSKGHFEIVKLFLASGTEINARNENGNTPLMMASANGQLKLVNYFIENGANLKVKNNSGMTSLHSASQSGHYNIAKMLIEKGANIHEKSNNGVTPLIFAAYGGSLELVKLLVENGADINTITSDKRTALHEAELNKHEEIVELLILMGAKASIIDGNEEELYATASIYKKMANFYKSNGNKAKMMEHYSIASEYFEKASSKFIEISLDIDKEIKNRIAGERIKEILLNIAIITAEVGQQWQAQQNSKQLAQMMGLRDAASSGQGYTGYYKSVKTYESALNSTHNVPYFYPSLIYSPDLIKHGDKSTLITARENYKERAATSHQLSLEYKRAFDCYKKVDRIDECYVK
jgi:hypothetical protein